jgi:SAM-dependent methyltransferase
MRVCLACERRYESDGWTCPGCGHSPPLDHGHAVLAPELGAGDGSDAEYRYEALAAVEPDHFWFRSRRRLILWALREACPAPQRVLEVGCGTGYVLQGVAEAFPHAALAGSDVLAAGLAFAQRRVPGASLFQMDARRIPFRDHFDAIGAFDVVEHVEEDEAVLLEMRRALRPGGTLILTVPQHPLLWSAVDEFSRHKRRYTRPELVAKVRAAGLEVLRATSFFSITLPLLLAGRLAKRRATARFDPESELRIHPLLNAVLQALADLERALIRGGLALPVGSSLLVAGRRPTTEP